ncbi:DUF6332 family protein [Streptomyces sp. CA2R106]|uniref:DUF6332 family protein n=1 Tax=Streptomyces sp. CA2R106 TaxID=3120153 RepID=UPI003008679D
MRNTGNRAGSGGHGLTGRRTQAEREAAAVEAMYALATAAVLGAAGFVVAAAPVLAGAVRDTWLGAAAVLAAGLFFGRVVLTLHRFERRTRQQRRAAPPAPALLPRGYGGGPGDTAAPDTAAPDTAAPLVPLVTPHRPRRVVRQAARSGGERRADRPG